MKRAFGSESGFTLIELLVVVLIIGILAAIALPQYKKAVRKARVAEAKILLKSFVDATDRYFLANNTYTFDMDSLDVNIPTDTKYWRILEEECASGINGTYGCSVRAYPKWETGYYLGYDSINYGAGPEEARCRGFFYCDATDETEGYAVCKNLGKHNDDVSHCYGSYSTELN